MTQQDTQKMALAAGFVTATLSEVEKLEAEALLASDAEFASLVADYRNRLGVEGSDFVSEKVWQAIERRLTGKAN